MLGSLVFASYLAATAFAQQPALTVTARPAFDGYAQAGAWTAVAVDVDNPGGEWKGSLAITGDEVSYSQEITVPGGGQKRFWAPVFQRQGGGVERGVELRQKGVQPITTRYQLRPISQTDGLVALVSDDSLPPGGLARAASPHGTGMIMSVQARAADLPMHSKGYGSIQAIFAARWQPAALQAEQVQALQAWLARGGLLVLSAEANLSRLQAPWLDSMMPAGLAGDGRADVLRALGRHGGAADEQARPGGPWSAKLEPRADARVILRAEREPLAACSRSGLGTICLLGFDISDPAVAANDGWTLFALELVGLFAPRRPSYSSYEDPRVKDAPMAQLLEEALGKVSFPSNAGATTLIFAVAYLLLLLPGNLMAFKFKNKADDAWIGMLAIILLSTAAAWGMGKARQAAVSMQGLLVVRAGSGHQYGDVIGWIGQFSGERRTTTLPIPMDADSAEEIRSGYGNQNMYRRGMPQAIVAPSAALLELNEERHALQVPMEAGSLRFYRLGGQRPLGEGLSLEWTEQGTERSLKWNNKTDQDFDALFVAAGGGQAVEARTRSAGRGSTGFLELTAKTIPLASMIGDNLTATEQKILSGHIDSERRDCPSCLFVVGVPPAAGRSARGAAGLPSIYVWSIRDERSGSLLSGRQLYLNTQGYRGNWNLMNQRLSLNSGQIVLGVPVGDLALNGRDLAVKLQGQWGAPPQLEVFDFESGRWTSEPQAAAAALPAGVAEFALPDARQAALALSPAEHPHVAQITPAGTVLLSRLEGTATPRARLDVAADGRVSPALAFDSSHNPHVVYRKGGHLIHAAKNAGKWTLTRLPKSENGDGPSLAFFAGALHVAYAGPEGVREGVWDGRQWNTSLVAPAPARQPVAVVEGLPGQTCVCYSAAGAFACATGSGGTWTVNAMPSQSRNPLKSIDLMNTGSRHGGRLQGLLVTEPGPGGWQVERVYGFQHMRTPYQNGAGINWSRNAIGTSERIAAGVMVPGPGINGMGAGQQMAWSALLTESGQIQLVNPNGTAGPTEMRATRPPFAFAVDSAEVAYFLYRGERGLVLRRDTDRLRNALGALGWRGGYMGGMHGGKQERLAVFKGRRGYIWEEAGVGRVRLTTQNSLGLDAITYQAAP